jgi:ribosomal protein S18 acetylase RimI-like enzyme
VYRFRPFLNTDPPHLASIWRSQPPQRGVLQPVSAPLLEFGVFSKLNFDREGLIVATRDDQPCGFVHAGFGPSDDGNSLDTSLGTTQVLMVQNNGESAGPLADDLLARSEEYLRSRGAGVIYAGGINPLNSFYLGLYGGSEIPGVLQSDSVLQNAALRGGYRELDRVRIMQCDLARIRPPVSRELRAIKRTTQLVEKVDPPPKSWWEACVWGSLQRDVFSLVDRSRTVVATASFWDMQPLSACWGMCTAGLFDLYVDRALRRRGYASYLLGEAIRILRRRGVATIEAQSMGANEAAHAFYTKLGFTEVDHGIVYRKEPEP